MSMFMSMSRGSLIILVLIGIGIAAMAATVGHATVMQQADTTIIALERGALDRWGRGDPQGYLELFARDVTYFDPATAARLDGIDAMKRLLEPLAGKIKVDRYEMIKPHVYRAGDVAILTFNLASHGKSPDGRPFVARWNSTEVYAQIDGHWKIVHSHWSYTKPELKGPALP